MERKGGGDGGEYQDEDLYRVLYDYVANHDDELTLVKGQNICVLSKDYKVSGDDGWWTGVNVSDGRRGIFPNNYVEPLIERRPDEPPHIPYTSLEFKDCIGAGGFGKVYRGYWRRSDNKLDLIAIKEAKIEGDKDDLIASIKQNVLQEARLFWILRHPNIIQLKGVCFHETHFCLVMEYAKGGSLGRLLNARKNGFPPVILIKWALQVSNGMYYLHEQALTNRVPIIHRDIKSSNILLSEDALN